MSQHLLSSVKKKPVGKQCPRALQYSEAKEKQSRRFHKCAELLASQCSCSHHLAQSYATRDSLDTTGVAGRAFSVFPTRIIGSLATYHATSADTIRKYPDSIRSQSIPASSAMASSVEPIERNTSTVVMPLFSREAKVIAQVIAATAMNQKPNSGNAPCGRATLPVAYKISRIPYAVQNEPHVPCMAKATASFVRNARAPA